MITHLGRGAEGKKTFDCAQAYWLCNLLKWAEQVRHDLDYQFIRNICIESA